MGMESGPSLLSQDEKKGLEETKQELKNTDINSSLSSFATQLTSVKNELNQNRDIVANLFKGVEEFHEAQSKLFSEEVKNMKDLAGRRI